ncbi:MAG: cytochrome bc complex cytochrome b subunit [Nitrososphaerota archaeon]|nr:cytochrome bc complex cytochrome b subunit [Nitrososphaerota archaeon]
MEEAKTKGQSEDKLRVGRLAQWFDARLGLSYDLLRPVPEYALSPFYWLGALAVVAFVIQGITGTIMMLYYVPSPSQAYSSTMYIFNNVSYGRFLETVHLYTAYAMIMLAFMHLMRGYFVSVHRKPREVMWIVGMIMGFVTLGFGFTGYLLPWTVVSKSATDVGIGMINALPPQVSSFLSFLIVGGGGDSAELLRFYDLHVVVLPAVLLLLLAVKMYMLETHGISGSGQRDDTSSKKMIPIFPDASFYVLELAALFGAVMLLVSVLFPLSLPPEYTPQLAAQSVAQPDWYFLWLYQILKISVFEGAGLPIALSLVTILFVAIFLLPFIDRTGGEERSMSRRPRYVTLGAIFIAELVTLAYWGEITPGQVIPTEQAVLVLGGIALLVTVVSFLLYRLTYGRKQKSSPARDQRSAPTLRSTAALAGALFATLAGLGALLIGDSINAVAKIVSGSATPLALILPLTGLVVFLFVTVYLLYRMDLAHGMIRRRVRALEVGWSDARPSEDQTK